MLSKFYRSIRPNTIIIRHFLWLMVGVSVLLSLAKFHSFPVGTFFVDDAEYIIMAEALSSGQGYYLINFPYHQPRGSFPPGWPLLLAPATAVFPNNFDALRAVSLLLWLSALPLLYRLLAERFNKPYTEIVLLLIVINPHLVTMSGVVMSEAAYLFFSLLTISLFHHWERQPIRRGWLLGIVFLLALFTVTIRTIGISLVAALLLHLLIKRHFRPLLVLGSLGLLGLLPALWYASQQADLPLITVTYANNFRAIAAQLGQFIRFWQYAPLWVDGAFTHSLLPVFDLGVVKTAVPSPLALTFHLTFLLVVLSGFIQSWRRQDLVERYVLLYFGLLYFWVAWAGHLQIRLLLPVVPFLTMYLAQSLISGIGWLQRYAIRPVRIWAVPFILLAVLLFGRNLYDWANPPRLLTSDLTTSLQWLREHAPANAIVMTTDPVPDYLYIRRSTIWYPPDPDIEVLDDYLANHRIAYVVVKPKVLPTTMIDQEIGLWESVFSARPERFQEIYRNSQERVSVYKVINLD
jgi:hypothetical protein